MALHPALAALVGTWHGGGTGVLPGMDPFDYDEEISFLDIGNGDLTYLQRAWVPGGDVLHAEAGVWRLNDEVGLIVTVAFPRVVEVSIGTAAADRWEVATTEVARAPGGAQLVASVRRYRLAGVDFAYEIDLAAGNATVPTPHLAGVLTRVQSMVK